MKLTKKRVETSLVLILILSFFGCKKFVTVSPPVTSITGESVYNSDANAISAVTSLYSGMMSSTGFSSGLISMSLYPGLSADELSLFGTSNSTYPPYFINNLNSASSGLIYWNSIYPMLFTINSAIVGISNSSSLTPAIQQQLIGEAKFMRAFCYFYLVNMYGHIPLVTGTDYSLNSTASQVDTGQIYQQIISDLKDCAGLLSANYLDGTLLNVTTERVRPTKWAAAALLARTYLYVHDWQDAESEADSVINNVSMYQLVGLDTVFLKNNSEAIWQLQPVLISGQNTPNGILFILPAGGPGMTYPVYLSNFLVNAFESGDQRMQHWVGMVQVGGNNYYYPFKYKANKVTNPVKEYEMVLRLGEQYLIRAEARAQEGNIGGAISDVNLIRSRAGLPDTLLATQGSTLNLIYHERQVELFTEWGNRWLDLKRTGLVSSVMGSPGNVCQVKGGSWNSNWALYPIPLTEIQRDANLVQNPGY